MMDRRAFGRTMALGGVATGLYHFHSGMFRVVNVALKPEMRS